MLNVAVAGASGYAGGEILRLLLHHPQVRIGALTAAGSAGTLLGEHHPALAPLAARELVATSAAVLNEHDVVFLALPHGASAEIVGDLDDSVVVLDCGADFRLTDPAAWAAFYGEGYAGAWPYGLPELIGADGRKQREVLAGASRIAIPGCYPTAVSLAMAPAYASGLVHGDAVVVAASGTSGAGKSLKPHLLGSQVMGAMSPYGVGGSHRHTPEIEQNLTAASGSPVQVSFTPTLAPMPRGILATCSAQLVDNASYATVRAAYESAYGSEEFVDVLPEGQWPNTGAVLGSNRVQVQLAVDERLGRLIVISAIDNLTKGTAGGAVQCMNIASGFAEATALPTTGVAP